MRFTQIRAAINSKLLTIPELAVVYNYHSFDLEEYPAATFEPSEMQSEFYTNNEDKNVYVWNVFIHQLMPVTGRGEALRRLLVAVDAVKIALAGDPTLGGEVDSSKATTVTFENYNDGNSSIKMAAFRLECLREERAYPAA